MSCSKAYRAKLYNNSQVKLIRIRITSEEGSSYQLAWSILNVHVDYDMLWKHLYLHANACDVEIVCVNTIAPIVQLQRGRFARS
jgi:hypothetical protein